MMSWIEEKLTPLEDMYLSFKGNILLTGYFRFTYDNLLIQLQRLVQSDQFLIFAAFRI